MFACIHLHFNTTLVLIKLPLLIGWSVVPLISIQLLFLLNHKTVKLLGVATKISIQLLFLLNYISTSIVPLVIRISIQLLFLLNSTFWNSTSSVYYFNTTLVLIKPSYFCHFWFWLYSLFPENSTFSLFFYQPFPIFFEFTKNHVSTPFILVFIKIGW